MRSQETPVSGLTMHLLLMHLRQWEWRVSIFSVLILAQVGLAGNGGDGFNPGTKSEGKKCISQVLGSHSNNIVFKEAHGAVGWNRTCWCNIIQQTLMQPSNITHSFSLFLKLVSQVFTNL